MGLKDTVRRLRREAAELDTYTPDEATLQAVEDFLTEHAIALGELDPADVPNLEESRRRADEVCAELEDEWRRLEERQEERRCSRGA